MFELLPTIKSHQHLLTEFERNIVNNTINRFKLYGSRTVLSDKQRRVLHEIWLKVIPREKDPTAFNTEGGL